MSHGGTPRSVEIGASLVAIAGLFATGQVAYGVLMNLQQDDWSSGARAVFLVLNSIVLIFGIFILVLGRLVRRGKMWAWITSLVLLPFAALFGAIMMLIVAVAGSIPVAGTGVLVASIAAIVTLTAPRSARDHFTRRRVPPAPLHVSPMQAYGPPPGHR
ncbi:hypothetical protein AB0J83_48290 [Actinoplanes sp. NPDC049596]|uniref:hypothetical protein n=1 Tax=unclassified Actinoplanes TaxID=2626549 RepID=UPI00342D7537